MVHRNKKILAVMVVLVLLASAGAVLAAQSAEDKGFDCHATAFSYFFEDGDMDFHFGNLVLGSAPTGGVEIGEAFYAASRIEDGSARDWQREFLELARRVESRGERSLAAGHEISARDQFLRAAYYYRISLVSMLPTNPEMVKRANRSRELMKKAGALMDPPLEYVEIPFEDTVMPGFFLRAKPGDKPNKTLIMVGGGETFAEDLYFYIAPQAKERGWNFLTVDLPGQGLLPLEGKVFRPKMHPAMRKVVDYALSRPDVDPERLAAFGYSGGGGFVPQAAQHDPRIKAIAMSSAVVDAYPLFSTMPAVTATPEEIDSWSSFHRDVVRTICWRWGLDMDDPAGLADANRGYTFDPAEVTVPALIIVGESEMGSEVVKKQQEEAMKGFPHPAKKMVVTPSDEGATNHCIMENRSIVAQVLFDWLDEVFK